MMKKTRKEELFEMCGKYLVIHFPDRKSREKFYNFCIKKLPTTTLNLDQRHQYGDSTCFLLNLAPDKNENKIFLQFSRMQYYLDNIKIYNKVYEYYEACFLFFPELSTINNLEKSFDDLEKILK